MEIISQIVKSRKIIKEVLKNEYDTDNLPIYSIEEVDKLFDLESTNDNPYKHLGKASNGNACNLILNHKFVKNHKLHIIYYNFQKNGKTKTMKSIVTNVMKLYDTDTNDTDDTDDTENIFKYTDNMIIILNEPIRDTIQVLCNELNMLLKEQKNDMIENDIGLDRRHFGNVFMFDIKTLQFNILDHEIVPEHIVYRNKVDIEKILEDCNCNIEQLPIILKNDPVSKLKMLVPGDICKIMRTSKTCGEYPYYRVCK